MCCVYCEQHIVLCVTLMCDTQEELGVTHTKEYCVSLLLDYGVATISRLLKIICLFCRI